MAAVLALSRRGLPQMFLHMRGACLVQTKTFDREAHGGVRIGCASGFWGDTSMSTPQLVHHGNIDYLVYDYLSEITMSLLARVKAKNTEAGYAPDFLFAVGPLLKEIKEKGIKVISNAGGINPISCGKALQKACKKANVDLNIAVVTGDDLMPKLLNGELSDFDFPEGVQSMNAYLGAGPIARSLDLGADIVITGRCVDSAVTLAPLLHKFQWDYSNYDLLASGSLAGHLIECGAQVTGGIFTDWELSHDWDNMGFPIVECYENGDFIVTKPPNTGGIVNTGTVAEQIVYEIGDPANYLLPDVTCKFSNVTLKQVEDAADTIAVTGVTGKKPSDSYKVSATYMDGFRATAVSPVIGPHSVLKGERVASAIIKRCQTIFQSLGLKDFKRVHMEMIGSEGSYGKNKGNAYTKECVSWLAVEHEQKKALDIFVKELASAGTGMAPGLTTIVGGRPKVSPIFKLHSFLYPKSDVEIDIHMNGELVEKYKEPKLKDPSYDYSDSVLPLLSKTPKKLVTPGIHSFLLSELAYTRSGDKGNDANIGVICRNPDYYPYLSQTLTAQSVEQYFIHLFEEESNECRVKRYDMPGINGFNFVLKDVLGGGGIASLRSDPQGKGLGQMLLDFRFQHFPEL